MSAIGRILPGGSRRVSAPPRPLTWSHDRPSDDELKFKKLVSFLGVLLGGSFIGLPALLQATAGNYFVGEQDEGDYYIRMLIPLIGSFALGAAVMAGCSAYHMKKMRDLADNALHDAREEARRARAAPARPPVRQADVQHPGPIELAQVVVVHPAQETA